MFQSLFRATLSVVVVCALSPTADAEPPGLMTFTENFEGGNNTGAWTFGNSFETIETSGGHPGAFLHNFFLDSIAAQPRTTVGTASPFTGDYRARGVSFVGADLAVFSVDTTTQGRPLSVILSSDSGTPEDSSDDCSVHRVGGHPTPLPNGNWARYRFGIRSQAATLPAGWVVAGCPGRSDDQAWNQVMTDVDRLRFFTGDPALFFIIQVWEVGFDNPTIGFGTPDPGP